MSYLGSTKIGKMFLGGIEIGKAYLGNNLVFDKGGEPAPPQVLPVFYDYLAFDGTACIETNIVLSANCSIRVPLGYESSKSSAMVFFAYDATTGGRTGLLYGGGTSATRRQMVPMYDSTAALSTNKYLEFSYSSYNAFMTPNGFGWGRAFYSYTKGSLHPGGHLYIGGHPDFPGSAPYTGRVQTIQIYGSDAASNRAFAAFDSNTPVATLRPCTYNGAPGLWHVEAGAFYGNSAAAGTLTVGNN